MRFAVVPAFVAALVVSMSASVSGQSRNIGVVPVPGAGAAQGGGYGESWAVVIGINDYQHERVPKLQFAVNDARAVETTLLGQGFKRDRVITLIDRQATKSAIERVLGDQLRSRMGLDDRLLVFFAGHGKTDRLRSGDEEGYLIPVDGDPSNLFSTAIGMDSLRKISDRLPAKHVLYVMDACYSGYAVYNRSISDELLDEMLRKPAIQILTAGRNGDEAQERAGHGVFTEVFLRGIQGDAFGGRGWVALDQLGAWVRDRVYAESSRRQVPQFGTLHGEGQFVFVKPAARVVALSPRSESPRIEIREEVRQQLGTLAVSARLAGVEVWLDDQRLGETKIGRAIVVDNVADGMHRVRARKAGHKDWEREIAVAANQRAEIVIDIEPLRPDPPVTATRVAWRMQSTFPVKSVFHEAFVRFATAVDDASSGRLKIQVLPAGAVVPAFQLYDAVHNRTVDGGYGTADYLYGKARWTSLFAGAPFGLTAEQMNEWWYRRGGAALRKELDQTVLRQNVVVFLAGTTGERGAGWFRRPITSASDFQGLKIRGVSMRVETLTRMGAAVNALPGGEIVPALDRGLLDAVTYLAPSEDMLLGIHEVAKYYYRTPGWQSPTASMEIVINRRAFESLPDDLQRHVEDAARQTNLWMLGEMRQRNARALNEMAQNHGVKVLDLPESIVRLARQATDRMLEAEAAKDPNFARVLDSMRSVQGAR